MPPTAPFAALRELPLEDRMIALFLPILIERISSLPKADRDDLFELLQELKNQSFRSNREELEATLATMEEILTQTPVQTTNLVLGKTTTDPEGLVSWKQFVAKNIKEQRKKAGLSQEELAEKSGLLQSHISRLENAQFSATHHTLKKIATALRIPLSLLDPSAE